MGTYEKMAFDKEKAIKEGNFKGEETSDEDYDDLIRRIDELTVILKDDKLFKAECEKYRNK
jgi:hypothetical protein